MVFDSLYEDAKQLHCLCRCEALDGVLDDCRVRCGQHFFLAFGVARREDLIECVGERVCRIPCGGWHVADEAFLNGRVFLQLGSPFSKRADDLEVLLFFLSGFLLRLTELLLREHKHGGRKKRASLFVGVIHRLEVRDESVDEHERD